MLADECAEQGTRSPKAVGGSPMGLYLYVKNVDKVVERAISLGAKLLKPVDNNFWGDRCGSLEDPFGYQWTLATHVEDVSSREIKKRAAQFSKKTA